MYQYVKGKGWVLELDDRVLWRRIGMGHYRNVIKLIPSRNLINSVPELIPELIKATTELIPDRIKSTPELIPNNCALMISHT